MLTLEADSIPHAALFGDGVSVDRPTAVALEQSALAPNLIVLTVQITIVFEWRFDQWDFV